MEEYIKNNYGRCTKDKCSCLKDGWRGTACPFWQPVKENSWNEMIERLKKECKEESFEEKWKDVLKGDLPPIKDVHKRKVTTIHLPLPTYEDEKKEEE